MKILKGLNYFSLNNIFYYNFRGFNNNDVDNSIDESINFFSKPYELSTINLTDNKFLDYYDPDKKNIFLITSKNYETSFDFFITDKPVGGKFMKKKNGTIFFPLFLNYKTINDKLFVHTENTFINFHPDFMEFCRNFLPDSSYESIFFYIYGILNSEFYLKKFIPPSKEFYSVYFTDNKEIFDEICSIGKEITDNNLLKIKYSPEELPVFKGEGYFNADNISYISNEKMLFINETQYFEGVDDIFNRFSVGDYLLLKNYFNDKTGNVLKYNDITLFQKLYGMALRTINLRTRVNSLVENILK